MADPYLSELKYLGAGNVDFIEVAVSTGTDVSNVQVVVYNPDGTVRSTDSLGVKVATVAGKDVYVIDKATAANFNGLHKLGAVALVNNGTVLSFVSFDDGTPVTATEGAANGMTSTQIGQAGSGESLETIDGGATYSTQTTPNSGTVPCFVTGTMIRTEFGDVSVENLKVGDRIVTIDNGLQEIRWIGQRPIDAERDQRPVCIPKDSFGQNTPNRNLYVSPNHRVLLGDAKFSLLFGAAEVLVAAKFLTSDPAFYSSDRGAGLSYFHILFDEHEVIYSNNLQTESFHPGTIGMDAFDTDTRDEILQLFPQLHTNTAALGATARMCLKEWEAEIVIASNTHCTAAAA